jgi:hypothetical protein
MGMFDDITCKVKLPLTEELEKLNIAWEEENFQTKSLECYLQHYIIASDGQLLEEVVVREYVEYTKEELDSPDRKPWNMFKNIIEKERYLKAVDFHGIVNFYTSLEYTIDADMWVEFNAYFIYGKLDKIELVEAKTMIIKSPNQSHKAAREATKNILDKNNENIHRNKDSERNPHDTGRI